MLLERAIRLRLLVRRNPQVVGYTDIGDLDCAFGFGDIAFDRGCQIIGERNDLARCQRAGKGAEQSSTDRRDHVVERGRVLFLGLHAVEFRDAAVHAVGDGFVKVLDERVPYWRHFLDDVDVAGVDDVSHGGPFLIDTVARHGIVGSRTILIVLW